MDNRFYDKVIGEMQPFLNEQNFSLKDDGSFQNAEKAVKVEYDEARQMYILLIADISEGAPDEYSEACAWLFDDTQNAKDAESVGIDFTSTLRSKMGIKIKRNSSAADLIDLPSGQKNGVMTISGFTKKVLDVFPQYKDSYREHVAKYNKFLYLNFFADTLVPQICTILEEGNRKQVKKVFELLENAYLHGDKETVNTVVAVAAAAICKKPELKDAACDMMEGDKHLQQCVLALVPVLSKKKKLYSTLIKG